VSFCSIHFGVVQHTKRYTAIARLAYQTSALATDRFQRVDYRCYAGFHVGGGVLLPAGAPAQFAQWDNFYAMAAFRETSRNAQDGRILDFALPRAVPRDLLLPLAAFALMPFVGLGMAVRLDVECVPASDGEPNPHAHAWLAQRKLEQDGFGLKERSWNTLFRRDGGRYVRGLVAAQITLGCAILDVDAFVDPRRNDARGAFTPEQRLPRKAFNIHNAGGHVEEVEQLKASRQLKRDRKAPKHAPQPEVASTTVTNAAVDRVNDDEAAGLKKRFTDAAEEAGYELKSNLDAASGLPTLSLSGTSVAFDGRAFLIARTGGSEDAAIVARFVRQLDWPALVVEGGPRLADLMAIAAANEGVFMVNRAPSAAARNLISRAFFDELKAAIAHHDPLGLAAKLLADFEENMACTHVDEPVDEAFVQAASQVDLQSVADRVPPNTVPAQPVKAAGPASAFAPTVTTSGNDGRAVAAGSDARQTAGSPSEAVDDLESLPDGDSWKIESDPPQLAKTARYLQAYANRQLQELEEVDEIMRRMRDRSSELRETARPPPGVGFSPTEKL
jgi:hypothetical protein